jgi:hypothetical protein
MPAIRSGMRERDGRKKERHAPKTFRGTADQYYMSSISGFSPSYVQQALASAIQSSGLSASTGANSNSKAPGTSISSSSSDSAGLSSFAQLVSTLQQLQQSNPTQYKEVTQQISTNLVTAAQTAKSQGNSGAANQLTQLANDFSAASQTGQLPNFQSSASTSGTGGHHHHHHGSSSSSSSSSASSASASTSDSDSSSSSTSLDPATIISNTLSNAGISVSGS